MAVSTFRIGGTTAAEHPPKGALRLACVRYLPRGMSEAERLRRDLYDAWLPLLAPSAELLAWARAQDFAPDDDGKAWARFAQRYRREMTGSAEKREALKLMALLATRTGLALGCYCAAESRCHRSLLKALVDDAGAAIAG